MSQNLLINSLSFVLNEVNIGANEFLVNLSIALWLPMSWYGQVNSLTYEQLKKFEHFDYLF
jgi:hypothetical protein